MAGGYSSTSRCVLQDVYLYISSGFDNDHDRSFSSASH